MLKKIAIAVLTTGFAVASFAQVGAGAPNSIPHDPPKAAEQKAETPKPVKHVKKHHKHHHHKKTAPKADTAAMAK
jgi:hypothetical protein